MDGVIFFRYTIFKAFADRPHEPGVAQSAERNPAMTLAFFIILALLLAFAAATTLLKAEPAPVRVRVDDVERLRRRR